MSDAVLPPVLSFNFGPEEKKLEISCHYTEKNTIFRLIFDGQASEQTFCNIFGQPTVLNILSNRNADSLDSAYPNQIDRIRFVKGVLYTWVTYRLGVMDILGTFSKLIDRKKMFEDYVHRELLEIVIAPLLRSIRDGKKHLHDMPEAVLVFADIASREIETFLLHEVDPAEIFDEEEFKTDFKERLTQVNANLAIKAVQALSAADIDRISKIGETIEDLRTQKVDLPEFEQMRQEFRDLCSKLDELRVGNPPQAIITQAPQPSVDVDHLIKEINDKKTTLEEEIAAFRLKMQEIQAHKPEPQIIERVERVIVQTDFSSDGAQTKIMRNLNRKSLKVLDKMFGEDDC
jgi:hypothetical protein